MAPLDATDFAFSLDMESPADPDLIDRIRVNVPPKMREAKRWLGWKAIDGRKIPFYASGKARNGKLDSSEDVAQLVDFEEAAKAYEHHGFSGLGFALGPDGAGCWQGVDFDHLSEHPELLELASRLPGYIERSPSGDGLHVLGYGDAFKSLPSNESGIEAYSRARFFTMTGDGEGSNTLADLMGFVARELAPRHGDKVQPPANDAADWALGDVPEWISGAVSDDLSAGLGIALTPKNRERLQSAVQFIDLDSEETYRKFVWSCKTAGLEWKNLCREACQKSDKFDEADFEATWDRGEVDRISDRWIFAEAARNGWREPEKPDETEQGLEIVDLADFEKLKPEPVESVLGFWLPLGFVTLLGAHGGSGKSYLALIWGIHVALGAHWGSLGTRRGKVLFLSLEDGRDVLLYRLRRIIEGYGLGDRLDEIKRNLRIVDGSRTDGALVREVALDGVREAVETSLLQRFNEIASEFNPDFIVVDNASDAFAANEINRQQVRGFIRMLTRLAEWHNAAVLLLAHIDKAAAKNGANGNSYSGSTQWHNSTRSRIAFIDGVIVHEKSNHSALANPMPVHWDNESGVFKPDPGGTNRLIAEMKQSQSDDDAVLEAMKTLSHQGGDLPAALQGPRTGTLWWVLRNAPHLPPKLKEDSADARRRIKASVDRLAEAGEIIPTKFHGTDRHERAGWIPAGMRECCGSAD